MRPFTAPIIEGMAPSNRFVRCQLQSSLDPASIVSDVTLKPSVTIRIYLDPVAHLGIVPAAKEPLVGVDLDWNDQVDEVLAWVIGVPILAGEGTARDWIPCEYRITIRSHVFLTVHNIRDGRLGNEISEGDRRSFIRETTRN